MTRIVEGGPVVGHHTLGGDDPAADCPPLPATYIGAMAQSSDRLRRRSQGDGAGDDDAFDPPDYSARTAKLWTLIGGGVIGLALVILLAVNMGSHPRPPVTASTPTVSPAATANPVEDPGQTPTTATPVAPAAAPIRSPEPSDQPPSGAFIGSERPGFLLREWWLNIPGKAVEDLTSKPAFPDHPDGAGLISSFEGPTNWKDNYGQRLRGFLLPPATGSYVFWISGDDTAGLWLSSDDRPEHKQRIASVPRSTKKRAWTSYAVQQSAPITLIAGKRCYVEVLHKEGTIDDHIAVGWLLPDGSKEQPIPGNRLITLAADGVK